MEHASAYGFFVLSVKMLFGGVLNDFENAC